MGWGGARPGSGRKPLSDAELAARNGRKRRGPRGAARVLSHPSVPTTNPTSPIEEFDAPDDLTAEERAVWLKQAPHAFANRTLTRATALAFERYCKVVVLERKESESSGRGGANHRGLLKQINTYELQFMLVSCGKPMAEAEKPQPAANPLTKYMA